MADDNGDGRRPLRVLLWSPKGAGLHYGGPGTSAFRLYSKAASGQFAITLAHGQPAQDDYPLFAGQHLIHPMSDMSALTQWRFLRNADRWVDAHAGEFDVFHGLQGFHLTVRPAARASALGLPAVVKLAAHKVDLADKTGWRAWLGLPRRRRQLLARLGGVIAISDAIVEELRGYGFPESKIARIPNGVDTDQFRPVSPGERTAARAELGWPDRPTLIFVGGITPRKNPMVLVEAMGRLKEKGIDGQFVVVGPDHNESYTRAVKERARELNVDDRVTWFGFTTDVARLYRASDVFALPSSNEGMPNALLEAMASGLPSVVTPISGTTDLVRDDVTGGLAPAEPGAIAEALATYFTSPATAAAHGMAARQVIEERFSARAVLAAHERLFRRIMAGGPAAE